MTAVAPAERAGNAVRRLALAWRALAPDQRMAALAAVGLLLSMFLPWYEKNTVPRGGRSFVSDTVSAFGVVSFVEASVALVALAVLVLLFQRAENRAFHLPGGDGNVIFAAGLWATLLIFYRVFDRPNVSGDAGTVGIQWGFFLAFIAAGSLAAAGQRIRAARRPEPALPTADERVAKRPARRRARAGSPVDGWPEPPEYVPSERETGRAENHPTASAPTRPAARQSRPRRDAGPDAPTSVAGQLSFDEEDEDRRGR